VTLQDPTRRNFLAGTIAVCGGLTKTAIPEVQAIGKPQRSEPTPSHIEILRRPDRVTAISGSGAWLPLTFTSGEWTNRDIVVQTDPVEVTGGTELPIRISSPQTQLTHLHVRWNSRSQAAIRSLGDHWERSYGDLEWRGYVPDRVMPWYFLSFDGHELNGYGVKTQPSAFCFWLLDPSGVSLWLDIRNGGNPVELGDRQLHAAAIVTYRGRPDESPMAAARRFCARMCTNPRLPGAPLLGSNDWYYAYGSNTESGILRNADLMASVSPNQAIRLNVVIDDGWQVKARFPDLKSLASQIRDRGLRPGLWIRPVRASKESLPSMLLPQARFGVDSKRSNLAFDPTIPEALEKILDSMRTAVGWGYEFIKHDFSTYELLGRWGFEMGAQPTLQGWNFADRTHTNAEIIANLYRSLRTAAGDKVIILGCNTIGHLSAGIFEAQRIGDDTSGTSWDRTRRMGVNALAHRIAQHRTFSFVDPDCVAVTKNVDWAYTRQWLDLVARSGTALFVSPQEEAMGPDQRAALRDAFSVAASSRGEPEDWLDSATPQKWIFRSREVISRHYEWCAPDGAHPIRS
jgi:alpha-galactosidase